jgi:putative redox protein
MSVTTDGWYLGRKRCRLVHEPSGAEIMTDAPRDNAGEGALFSPTDLVAAALASCTMTILGIFSERAGLDLSGMRVSVVKEMRTDPRRIGSLAVEMHLPAALEQEDRTKLERAALACPVAASLHPDVRFDLAFRYDL